MINGENDGGGDIGGNDVYRRRTESALVLFSDLYSDNKIFVNDSRFSSHPAYIFYLTTSGYCPN